MLPWQWRKRALLAWEWVRGKHPQAKATHPARFRPAVELLEGRTLLTTGAFDPTFGIGGIFSENLPSPSLAASCAMAIQPDSKIVEVTSSGNDIRLLRENSNGTLDTTFGGGTGIADVLFPLGQGTAGRIAIAAVAVQPDGKILVAGSEVYQVIFDGPINYPHPPDSMVPQFYVAIPQHHFFVTRFNSDGTLDTTFGTGGAATIALSSGDDMAAGLALQQDGKIVLAGSANHEMAVVRLNADGSLDSSFSGDGKVSLALGTAAEAAGVAIQNDGKIVVAGSYSNDSFISYSFRLANPRMALVRYNSDGSLGSAFGDGGITTVALSEFGTSATALAIQSDGSIVAAGYTVLIQPNFLFPNSVFSLVRLTPAGQLDPTFGNGGAGLTAVQTFYTESYLALQEDGRIVLAGNAYRGDFTGTAVIRFNSDGSQDEDFRNFAFGVGFHQTFSFLFGLGIQPEGGIVVGGLTYPSSLTPYALNVARLESGYEPLNVTPDPAGDDIEITVVPVDAAAPGSEGVVVQSTASAPVFPAPPSELANPAVFIALTREDEDDPAPLPVESPAIGPRSAIATSTVADTGNSTTLPANRFVLLSGFSSEEAKGDATEENGTSATQDVTAREAPPAGTANKDEGENEIGTDDSILALPCS